MKDAAHRIPAPPDDPVPTHDVADAWRSDLEASGIPIPLPPSTVDRWALCLRIGTVLTRVATLPTRERRAYARSTGPVWEAARELIGDDRFLTVARGMDNWTGAAPPLPQFREILWAVEQVEAEGAIRVSLVTLRQLATLAPSDDLRCAYACAQVGRATRTLGYLRDSALAFEASHALSERHGDSWLASRTKLGLGVVHQAAGNFPAARTHYAAVLASNAEGAEELLAAAHLGLLSTYSDKRDLPRAIEHGTAALRIARLTRGNAVEVLLQIGEVFLLAGDLAAGAIVCRKMRHIGPKPYQMMHFHRLALKLAILSESEACVRQEIESLAAVLCRTPSPWEIAANHLVLGEAYEYLRFKEQSSHHLENALRIAKSYSFAELEYRASIALLWTIRETTSHLRLAGIRVPS